MSIYTILIILCLLLIIIFLIAKIIVLYISLKEVNNELITIFKNDTNAKIRISSNDKRVVSFVNTLNEYLTKYRNAELEYKNGNKNLQATVTNITHDIRTPLTVIKGYISLLEKNYQKEYFHIINEKLDSITTMTEDLLAYSKCLDHKEELHRQKVCLNELIEQTVITYYALFKNKNIYPTISMCNHKIYKNVDKQMIERVFDNILYNVVKYANKKVSIELTSDGIVTISNDTLTLDKVSVSKIFARYYTIENGSNNSGLGLSIAKELITLNGGSIKARYRKSKLIIEIEL